MLLSDDGHRIIIGLINNIHVQCIDPYSNKLYAQQNIGTDSNATTGYYRPQ